jgi:hypothetical protein
MVLQIKKAASGQLFLFIHIYKKNTGLFLMQFLTAIDSAYLLPPA